MHNYFIESFKITKLWGYRDIDLTFNNDVNVLIGPNGSGKTTVLNLLHSVLTTDIPKLLEVNFEYAEIKLKDPEGRSVLIIVRIDTTDNLLELAVGKEKIALNIADISHRKLSKSYLQGSYGGSTTIRDFASDVDIMVPEEFYSKLTGLVVWQLVKTHDHESLKRRLRRAVREAEQIRQTNSNQV